MENKKKVLVVGACEGEIPLVNAYHELGYEVILATMNTGKTPCSPYADKEYEVDIMDKEAVLAIAKKENVAAVSSNVIERAVRIVAWVAEKLGLEGIGYETAVDFTNKYRMRVAAERAGINVPQYSYANSVEEAIAFSKKVPFPLIMKPVDNGGSKGVIRVNNESELVAAFPICMENSVSDGTVIIERFIVGTEYNVDAFTHNYICENTDVATKRVFDLKDTCVPKCYMLQDANSCNTDLEQRLLKTNKQLVEGMDLKFGITHANYIYCETDDKIYLVEITARGGGDGISAVLVELATGINVSRLLALYSLGIDELKNHSFNLKHGASAWYGFELPEGEIISVTGVEDAAKIPGVCSMNAEKYPVGKKIKKLVDGSTKCGPIWVYAKSRTECDQIFEQIKKTITVKVKTPNGEIGYAKW